MRRRSWRHSSRPLASLGETRRGRSTSFASLSVCAGLKCAECLGRVLHSKTLKQPVLKASSVEEAHQHDCKKEPSTIDALLAEVTSKWAPATPEAIRSEVLDFGFRSSETKVGLVRRAQPVQELVAAPSCSRGLQSPAKSRAPEPGGGLSAFSILGSPGLQTFAGSLQQHCLGKPQATTQGRTP